MESLSVHQHKDLVIGENWILVKRIGTGGFGDVFLGRNIGTGEEVALKFEEKTAHIPVLEHEGRVYACLQGGVGIPKIFWCGTWNKYNVIVMELLGSSLEDLFNLCDRRFTVNTTLLLGDQIISRVEYVHKKDFVHRDIKPHNFLMGTGRNSDKVYLIDFGLTKPLQSVKEGGSFCNVGSVRFSSLNSHQMEQSKRDDLESVGYLMIYFLKGNLPWHDVRASTRKQLSDRIYEKKMSTSVEILCQGCPEELKTFIVYCRGLEFKAEPDYLNLRHSLREAMRKICPDFIYGSRFDYDWLTPRSKQSISDDQEVKENHVSIQAPSEEKVILRRSSRIREAEVANKHSSKNQIPARKRRKKRIYKYKIQYFTTLM